jgi:hypothetical protein
LPTIAPLAPDHGDGLRTSQLQLPLSKAGRKLVAKVKRGKKLKIVLTVTVRDAAGAGATAKRTVSVRR